MTVYRKLSAECDSERIVTRNLS